MNKEIKITGSRNSIVRKITNVTAILLLSFVVVAYSPTGVLVSALESGVRLFDFQETDIFMYDDSVNALCSPSTSATGAMGTNKDYKGRQVWTDAEMKTIQENQPIYEAAATKAGIPWQILPVLHFREWGLKRTNPPNGQGVYQDYDRSGSYPADGKYTDDTEFLRQSIRAAEEFRSKSSKPELLLSGYFEELKSTFFGYNGRAAVYARQAKELGFTNPADGSPYVMNYADAKRDPEVNGSTWGQIKTDGGGIQYPANTIAGGSSRNNYGAFVLYTTLTGVSLGDTNCLPNSSSGAGANGWEVTGSNAMQIYYQIKEPWASQSYGIGTIGRCGCGPTSVAMAVSSLKRDSTVTPKVIADLFAGNGGQIGGGSCGSTFALFDSSSVLSKKYGVKFTNLGTDMSKVPVAVKRGSFVLMSQNEGLFTTSGHLMLIRATTNSGKFLVADPADEPSTLDKDGRRSWVGGYTAYEISGQGKPEFSTGNTDKRRGNLQAMWEISKI